MTTRTFACGLVAAVLALPLVAAQLTASSAEETSLRDRDKSYIMGGVLVLLQGSLVAGLLAQRARRREAENVVRAKHERIQDLAGRLIAAQEEERARIARYLHDDVGQSLASLTIALAGLKRTMFRPASAIDVAGVVDSLQNRVVDLADDVRHLSHDLHPGVLRHVGLVAALRDHCIEFERRTDVAVTFDVTEPARRLNPDTELCVYRIAQEALNNAARHAKPRHVRVALRHADDAVELLVADDGSGFERNGRCGGGLGLLNIDERARLARGDVKILSAPGHGTTVQVKLPVPAIDCRRAARPVVS